jgi:hypothetical protein
MPGEVQDSLVCPLSEKVLPIAELENEVLAQKEFSSPPDNPKGGLGASAPTVARWLGDIHEYYPSSVVQAMQTDALESWACSRYCASRSCSPRWNRTSTWSRRCSA